MSDDERKDPVADLAVLIAEKVPKNDLNNITLSL
jgi:hypothetical protein